MLTELNQSFAGGTTPCSGRDQHKVSGLAMDFQRFGIDARLAEAAEGLRIDPIYYEKLLVQAVEKNENVCAKIVLGEGREEVLLLPALQWLLSGEARKVLVIVQDSGAGDRCAEATGRLGALAGIGVRRAVRGSEGEVLLEGDPSASVLIGGFEELLEASGADLGEYGYLVVEGADRIAELPSESVHKFVGALRPSWERRCLLACAKISVKVKNLAWDLAESPVELSIDGEAIMAQSVAKETWNLPGEDKLKFLLGLLAREKPERVCVFCNLRDTAREVSKRLEANGVGSDYILGALAMDRKLAALAKARSGELPCLVLTDLGAEGLEEGSFPLVVNYDIPLEPELFVKRLGMLDRGLPGAKLVSLACDRYIYGLSAVESYIDAKLEAVAAGEEMLAAEDKSEGMRFDSLDRRGGDRRQEPGDRGRGDDRTEGLGPRRRDQDRRDSRSRQSSRRGPSSREDRSPDIRRSISEATGGSLDMESVGSERRAEEARRSRPNRSEERKRGPEQRKRGPEQRGGSQRRDGRPKEQRSGDQRGAPAQRPPVSGNPYELPIEERMRRYREKYGQRLGGGPSAEGRKAKPQSGRAQQRPQERSVQAKRGGERPAAPPAPPAQPAKDGFFRKLFGSIKREGD